MRAQGLVFLAFLALAAAIPLLPQKPKIAEAAEETPTIRVDVDIANVLFSVRDKKGALIPNLNKEDFTIFEDGKEQTIRYFTRETELPMTLGLLVDVSGSQATLIEEERHAADLFFQQVLGPKDMAFLISFGSDAELLQDYTNSKRLLQKGLEGLRVNSSVSGIHPGPVPTASQPRGTILFDAVYLAAREKLGSEVGRKAMVIITDGVDQGSRVKIQEALEAAQKANAIIYSIYYVDARAYGYGSFGGYGDGDLKRMSEETGGRLFKVSRKNTLSDIFKQIQEEMRSQYAVGYVPTNDAKDGGFRRIEIKPKNKDLRVQARKGYFAAKS